MRPLRFLLDLLYPPKCPFCGRVLERGEEGWCASCQEELPWTGPDDAKTVESCGICLSPLWYQDGVRAGMHRYKFGGGRGHAELFGLLMAQCLQDRWEESVDLITWVPLHPKRKRKRGYDQAELLARRVGELAGLSVESTLEKVRATAVQSEISEDEARKANVKDAYRALPGLDLAGKRIVLIDDVVTTGATLWECAAALRQAGAASVVGLTFARAR
ncbi:MAG: double zinc ribbon domain-containing protein [Oscillospiraceae bacterium]|nr:double zinc ribbon domain-containing protein [Oscillospiraceae bacterium]MDE7170716.1 double zinc ribbon domain-containing protein [Oscillospiraceae bacterium]